AVRCPTRRFPAKADDSGALAGRAGVGVAAKLFVAVDVLAHSRLALCAAAVDLAEPRLSLLREASAGENGSGSVSRSGVHGGGGAAQATSANRRRRHVDAHLRFGQRGGGFRRTGNSLISDASQKRCGVTLLR